MLDNALEFMVMSGMDLPLAVMVTIPAPWEHDKYMDSEIKDFSPLLCNYDGAVGRTCIHPVLGW